MKIDAYIIATIEENLKLSGLTKSAFAEKLGKANSWVSKLLSGELQTLDDETSMRIQEVLDFDFFESGSASSLFQSKIKALSKDSKYEALLLNLIELRDKMLTKSDRRNESFRRAQKKKFLRFSEDAEFAIEGAKIVRQLCEEVEDRYLCLYLVNKMEEYMNFDHTHRTNLKTPPQTTNESS
mgnify:CR=1 FL=1